MDQKTLIAGIITLALSIILVGSILVPVVQDVQSTAGAEVTYSNVQSGYTFTLGESTDTVTFAVTPGDSGTVTYNGETVTDTGFAVVTDSVSVMAFSGRLNVIFPDSAGDYRPSYSSNVVVEYADGVCTFTNNTSSTVTTYNYSWIYLPDENGEWVTVTGSSNHYVNSINDVVCSGYYSTGDNDTSYVMRNGVVSVTEDFEASNLSTLTLVDGTTDVYKVVVSIGVGDESFTPWFILIKGNITGHESSGAAYSLYGVIPVIVIIAIVMMAAGMIYSKRD